MRLFWISIVVIPAVLLFASVTTYAAAGTTPAVVQDSPEIIVEVDGSVSKQLIHEGYLYVGGSFSRVKINDSPFVNRSNFAQVDLDNRSVTPLQLTFNGSLEDMLVHENKLYLGGSFTQINDQERYHIASLLLPSGQLSSWSPRVESVVRELHVENGEIVIVGDEPVGGSSSLTQTRYTLEPDIDTTTEVIQVNDTVSQVAEDPIGEPVVQGLQVDTQKLGFAIPTLSDVLTFAIRAFFVIAGLAALFYLLLGAFGWVTSGGDKDSVGAARDKIQAAIIGLIMMVVVLGIVWTLEQVVFSRRICLGISCPVTIPSLLEPPEGEV